MERTKKTTAIIGAISGFVGAAMFFGAFSFIENHKTPLTPNTGVTEVNTTGELSPISFRAAVSQENAIIDVVKKAEPAVLSIAVTKQLPASSPTSEDNFFNFPFNFQIPKNINPRSPSGTTQEEVGSGTAFLISADGLAVTNKHVVEDKTSKLTAKTNDGKEYEVEIIATDPLLDIAIIKLKNAGENLPYLELDEKDPVVGSTAIAIGNALGEFQNTVSVGVISGLARSLVASDPFGGVENLDEVIQTDAAINPGNSGGPLLNSDGKVVGINVALAEGGQSVGFAIPGSAVYNAVESVKSTGRIVRPYLGIRYMNINDDVKTANHLSVNRGAFVKSNSPDEPAVLPHSPAEKAGIKSGDIVLDIDGILLDKDKSLAAIIRSHRVGDSINVRLLRDGKEKKLKVKLEELKN